MLITKNLTAEDLISKLKHKKSQILKQQNSALTRMGAFFKNIRQTVDHSQRQANNRFEQDLLNFQQKAAQTIEALNKSKNNLEYVAIAHQYIKFEIMDGSKMDYKKIEQLLNTVYYINITNQHKSFHQQVHFDYPSVEDSQHHQILKGENQFVLQKLQDERDYYQRREIELLQRIKDLQNQMVRKGINIKEMSKSYLQQRCSKWAIERIREQNKILVQKIGEASQQIMRQNTLISEFEAQIKRLGSMIGETNSKSYIGNSSCLKNHSLIIQSGLNYRGSEISLSRDKESQLQLQNEQLRIQITSHIKRIHDESSTNAELQNKIEQYQRYIQNVQQSKEQLKQDVLISKKQRQEMLRVKGDLEQQVAKYKRQNARLLKQIGQEKQKHEQNVSNLQDRRSQILATYRQYELQKREQVSRYIVQISQLSQQKEQLLIHLNEASLKKGEETSSKHLLNDQISRLIKEINSLKKVLSQKQDAEFMMKQEMIRLQDEAKQINSKSQQGKKQVLKMKKASKELQKQNMQMKSRLAEMQNVQLKIAQIEHNYHLMQGQFLKFKQTSQKRINMNDKITGVLKEKYSYQLNSILGDQLKIKNKKSGLKCEIVQKYIDEMINFSNKSALVKQLKQQIRQLKQAKEVKVITKKKGNYEDIPAIESGVLILGNKILEQRLKAEKQLYELKVEELKEIISKEETIKSSLLSQLQNQKENCSSLKNKIKHEEKVEQTNKMSKQSQQKVQRLEQQLKRMKAKLKKSESDLSELQSQLKTKKQLIANFKSQLKMKEDTISLQQRETNTLKSQIQRHQRNVRQFSNKQDLLKDSKQYQKQLQQQNDELSQQLLQCQQKIRQLNRTLGKKQEIIKEYKQMEQKELKVKEESKIKELNNIVSQKNDQIKKLKSQVDRKDEIIKNHKNKIENKSKEFQEAVFKNEKDFDKVMKEKDVFQRKNETLNNLIKKEQLKNQSLAYLVKRIFEIICNQSKDEKPGSNANRLSTQYYTGNSAISNNNYKIGTPASNIKSYGICEGLQILNLRPQDLQSYFNIEQTLTSKVKGENSWSVTSPILNKKRQNEKESMLVQGLQQLQRLLNVKQINNDLILKQFKNIIKNE